MGNRELNQSQAARLLRLLRDSRDYRSLGIIRQGSSEKRRSKAPTQAEIAKKMGVTQSTYQKLEGGFLPFKRTNFVRALDALEATEAERAEILYHVDQCAPSKNDDDGDDTPFFLPGLPSFCEQERQATKIRTFQIQQFPAALQSSNYTLRQFIDGRQVSNVDAAWRFRRDRIEALHSKLSPIRSYEAIISQQALDDWLDGDDHNLVIEQLQHVLAVLARDPRYSLRILPRGSGDMFLPALSFSILSFSKGCDEAYIDTIASVKKVTKTDYPSYDSTWSVLGETAWPAARTTSLFREEINLREALRDAESEEMLSKPTRRAGENTVGGTAGE